MYLLKHHPKIAVRLLTCRENSPGNVVPPLTSSLSTADRVPQASHSDAATVASVAASATRRISASLLLNRRSKDQSQS